MKKWLFTAAVATTMLAACSQNEIVEDFGTQDGPKPIQFAVPLVNPTTRTIVSGVDYPAGASAIPFTVSAQYNENDITAWRADANNEFANNAAVTWKTDATDATYGGYYGFTDAKFWPKEGKLSFQAFSPTASDGALGVTGVTWTGFGANNGTNADQYDLLYANRVPNKSFNASLSNGGHSDDNNKVVFEFKHALAQVAFTARLQEEYAGVVIKLESVSLANVKNKATFNQNLSATAHTNEVGTNDPIWTMASDATSTTFNSLASLDKTVAVATGSPAVPAAVEKDGIKGYLVIPQDFATGASPTEVVVNYSIQQGSGAAINQTAKFVLSASNIKKETDDMALGTAFEMGKKYIFNLVFGLNEIKFKPTVSDWTEVVVYDDTEGTILPNPSPEP